jgi:ABC-type transport system substrate-binding protein
MTLGSFSGNSNDWYIECAEIIGNSLFGTQNNDKALADLCDTLDTTNDPDKLKVIYTDIYQKVMDTYAPNIYLYQPEAANAWSANLSGVTPFPETTADYRFMKVG